MCAAKWIVKKVHIGRISYYAIKSRYTYAINCGTFMAAIVGGGKIDYFALFVFNECQIGKQERLGRLVAKL